MKDFVKGEYELNADDLQLALKAMPENRALRWLPLVIIAPILGFSWKDGGGTFTVSAITMLIFVLVVVLFPALKGAARRQFQATRAEARHIRFHFDAEGFAVETQESTAAFKYSALYRFVDGAESLLLYTHHNIAQIFPKRAFSSDDLAQVQAWLSGGVRPAKQKNPLFRILVLWLLLIFMFLGIWLFLAPSR